MLFSGIVVNLNIILPNRRLAERHFPKSSFSQTSYFSESSFNRNAIQLNVIFPKWHWAECHFTEVIQLCYIAGPHHFPEESFHWFVVFPNNHIAEWHLTESSYRRIPKSLTLHDSERHFCELFFSRMSFCPIFI